MELRDRLQWNVRPRLLGVRGVSSVTIFGGEVRRFEVRVDPDNLAARGLTLADVLDATRQSTGVRGAGFIENDQQRVTVLAQGQATNPQILGETLVAGSVTATPVRLHDVAEVTSASTPKPGDASINGEPGVILVISKQFGVDTPTVTTRVEAELDKLMPELERDGVVYHRELFRQADFIELAVGNITHSLFLGAGLVAAVLIAFLFNLRIAVISLTAIPLSLLGAILTLSLLDVSLNTLTIGGLAIAVGEVVDDAIIDAENILRRLRENRTASQPRSAVAVVLSASLEVRSAVVYATLIVILVFVPVFFLSGIQGRLFAPLGYAYVLAVLASLVVAQALQAVPGADNVLIEPQVGAPQLVIRIRHSEIAARGLRAGDILDAVHAAFQGASMTQVYDGNRVIDVAVVIPSGESDPAIVANLWLSALPNTGISTSSGGVTDGRVQLGEVADVFLSDGRFLIAHEAGTRQIMVTCHVAGRDLESFVVQAERQVSELALPTSTRAVFAGELEAKRAAERELLLFSTVAGVGILLLLWTVFRSVRDVALLVVNLPFALVGGVAAVYITGGILNVGALIGFVTLFGISLRNGIMMISHWRHLGHEEGVPWGPKLVASGAKDRLAPVLMTALTTGLGLLPIAVGSGEAGREVEGPMAQVILGGLITSCLLNLIVLPSLYHRYGDRVKSQKSV